MDRIGGEKCLTICVHDVLEQRDGDGRGLGGSREKEKKEEGAMAT